MVQIYNYNKTYDDNGEKKKLYNTRFSLFNIIKGKIKNKIFKPSDKGFKHMIFYNWNANIYFATPMEITDIFKKKSWAKLPSNKYDDFKKDILSKDTIEEMLEVRKHLHKDNTINSDNINKVMSTSIYLNFLDKILLDSNSDKRRLIYKKLTKTYDRLTNNKNLVEFEYPIILSNF